MPHTPDGTPQTQLDVGFDLKTSFWFEPSWYIKYTEIGAYILHMTVYGIPVSACMGLMSISRH